MTTVLHMLYVQKFKLTTCLILLEKKIPIFPTNIDSIKDSRNTYNSKIIYLTKYMMTNNPIHANI